VESKTEEERSERSEIRYYEGERVYFRPVERNEEALVRKWMNDSANWPTLARSRPITQKDEIEALERLQADPTCLHFGIVRSDDDRLIGMTGLHQIDWVARCACLGIVVGPRDVQGQGFGSAAVRLLLRYAFREQNLNRVWLTCYSHNERGIRTYKQAGFQLEGRLRQAKFREGKYRDELCFGMLREEWEAREAEAADQDGMRGLDRNESPAPSESARACESEDTVIAMAIAESEEEGDDAGVPGRTRTATVRLAESRHYNEFVPKSVFGVAEKRTNVLPESRRGRRSLPCRYAADPRGPVRAPARGAAGRGNRLRLTRQHEHVALFFGQQPTRISADHACKT
jgi:RimJ/RimL family protein N-acetyltransferase